MSKYRILLRHDLKQIVQDPMLAASLFGPLLLLVIIRYLLPVIEDWMKQRYLFDLTAYHDFMVPFLLTAIAMLPGSMAGLLMLDERDENLIAYYAVTPFTRRGYFIYRLLLPTAITVLLSILFLLWSGIGEVRIASFLMIVLMAMTVPYIAMFLGAYASNKVEGLALSKACGLLFAGPVIVHFVPQPWSYLGAWIPSYWPAATYVAGFSNEFEAVLFSFCIGFAFHLAIILILLRKFLHRID